MLFCCLFHGHYLANKSLHATISNQHITGRVSRKSYKNSDYPKIPNTLKIMDTKGDSRHLSKDEVTIEDKE
jgi:hypothetical protein